MTGVEHVRVAIIGSGFSGLGMAIRLKRSGIHDFVVLERAGDLGGTWRDNDYPGCCCDIPSHVYSYSFELNPRWTRGFASQAEILEYLRGTAVKYGVLAHIRFNHEVEEAAWAEAAQCWAVRTTQGRIDAQILVSATGPLSDPSIPRIPGLEGFQGTVFHSARWRHDHDLTGERVAVIGTGASAIQFVPQIQPKVKRLHLFQRTAPWVIPRFDHRITPLEHWLLRWIPFSPAIVRSALYWALEVRVVGFKNPKLMSGAERVARWHLRRQVANPVLRRALTPDYTLGCKRILVSDDYYPALVQANVDLVTDAVKEVRSRSVVTANGTELEIDSIILGTGFKVADSPIAGRIRGRGGRTLAEAWKPSMQAYLGMSVAGFPNLFTMIGPNTGLGHNSMVFMIESQLNYIMGCLETMSARGSGTIEVRQQAQSAFNSEIEAAMKGTVWTAGHCHSWYLDSTGRNSTLWPGWSFRFRARTRRFEPVKYVVS
ncbi:MAG: NAD(P)/FAD-dependent oxidoreductase [Candidatus Dormibacteraeota bacterium]|uniref:NAD(P)/FAD-dependent oxidoreductase n=1 Tax=Candidatus Amunia macphersoniae TaxID=3127014 RepID=A0A934KI84_9BACT|nr:NAD(P)/FAD-dependent oxidoreductase [Candidatus Dormibacteraeota bacterium]